MAGRTHHACPACGVPVERRRGRSAPRWCGACGARLDGPGLADPQGDAAQAAGHRRRWLVPGVGVAVLATVVIVGTSVAGDRLAASRADLDVELGRDEVADALTDPASDDGPVCLRSPGCVAWVAPAAVAGRTPTATVVADLTLVRVPDGLEARDAADGTLRWRAPLTDRGSRDASLPVLTAGGLAVLTDAGGPEGADGRLLALDLGTGERRWQVPGVAEVADVRDHGEVLLAQLRRTGDPRHAGSGQVAREVVGVDRRSGTEVWSVTGDLVSLVADGAVIVGDGHVAVRDAAGDVVWREPVEGGVEPAWLEVTGRYVRLFDTQGRGGPARSLTDGSVFDHDGELVSVADVEAPPNDLFRTEVAALLTRRPDGATDLALVDGDAVTWQVTFDQLGCCAPIQLDDGAITVPAADGGRWRLSREDGEVLERTRPPVTRVGASSVLPGYGGVSVEELDVAAATTSELALVEDGRRTARLPAGTWPVGTTDEVVVVRGPAWVAAVHRDAPPDEDR